MSKAIQGAVELAGAVGMGVAAFFNPALIASPIFDKIWFSLAVGGISMEAGAIAEALTSNRGSNITTRQAAGFRQAIVGQQRIGGTMIFNSTTGSHLDQWNAVIALAGHSSHAIENIYLDGNKVYFQGSGPGWSVRNGIGFGGVADGNNHIGPAGKYNYGGTGHSGIYVEARYGDQAVGDVIGALTANDPTWAADGLGNSPFVGGCTYIYLKLEFATFPGGTPPEVRVTVDGKDTIFDPRTGTTGYTANWALLLADAITDTEFGLGDNSVNQDQLIAAANIADEAVSVGALPGRTEARYSTCYHWDTSVAPMDVVQTMLPGGGGRITRAGGEWFIWPAAWKGPSFNFDESMLTSKFQWNPNRSRRDLCNEVQGTWTAPNFPFNVTVGAGSGYDADYYAMLVAQTFPFAFQQWSYPSYAEDTLHGFPADQYLNADGGKKLIKQLDLPTVPSMTQAQRLAKIELRKNRQQGSGTSEMHLESLWMLPTDVFEFNFAENGWVDKDLELVGFDLKVVNSNNVPSVRCGVQVAETDISVYDDLTIDELTITDQPAAPTQASAFPAPPTNVVLTSSAGTAVIGPDGTAQPRIEVTWDTPLDILVTELQIRYSVSGANNWISAPSVDVSLNLGFISNVIAGHTYDAQIRSVRANGATSDWVQVSGEVVSLTLAFITQQAPHANVLFGEAFSDGTAIILVYPYTTLVGSITVNLLPAGPVEILGMNQGQLYWVYYSDPTTVGGNVAMIATQNRSDYLNKAGFYEVGLCIVPIYSAGSSGLRYLPTTFSDVGTSTTSTPALAFDQDPTTAATVSARTSLRGGLGSVSTFGQCTWGGFPPVVTIATATLVMVAQVVNTGFWASVGGIQFDINIGGTFTPTAPPAPNVPTGTTTYLATIPAGTDLSTVNLQVLISQIGSTHFSGAAIITQLYIQT